MMASTAKPAMEGRPSWDRPANAVDSAQATQPAWAAATARLASPKPIAGIAWVRASLVCCRVQLRAAVLLSCM